MIERKPTSITVRKGSTFALACHKAELISFAVFEVCKLGGNFVVTLSNLKVIF